MSVHADARAVLTAWSPPDAAQDALRRDVVDFLDRHADGVARSCRTAHVTASTLVVQPGRGRVLLVRHALVGRWLQLGGHIEPTDATLGAAAAREAHEESGIAALRMSAQPLRIDRHTVECRWNRTSSRLDHLDVQYAAHAADDAGEQSEGSAPLQWFAWDALPEDTDDAVRALVRAARASLGE